MLDSAWRNASLPAREELARGVMLQSIGDKTPGWEQRHLLRLVAADEELPAELRDAAQQLIAPRLVSA